MTKLIIANWKMNGSILKVNQDLTHYATQASTNLPNIVFALPAVYLHNANQIKAQFNLASQDVSKFVNFGAYTGELSANMLVDVGVEYVLVGHSERRQYLHEVDEILRQKLDNVINSKLTPVFCFGEELALRENNTYQDFLLHQLNILTKLTAKITKLVIAYEPIWAIGTGKIPTSNEILEIMTLIHSFVQKTLPHVKITTLYGGSVTSSNITEILQIPNVGGVLVGGASLKVEEFTKICAYA